MNAVLHRLARALCLLALALPLAAQRSGPGPTITSVELAITDPHGGPLQSARVQLLGFVPVGKTYRKVPGQEPRDLTPRDFPGQFATLADLPAGEYVLRVDVDRFATTLSEPFTIPSLQRKRLVVKVPPGATLEGVIQAPDGKPLAEVAVHVEDAARLDSTHPLAGLLADVLAETRAPALVRTDAEGRYRIEHVAKGPVRVVANHADFVPDQREVAVDGDDKVAVPPMKLAPGVRFVGTVLRGGRAVAGAEVVLQSVPKGKFPGSDVDRIDVLGKVVTDAEGHFRMPDRVPFGSDCELMANVGGAPLQKAGDMAASRRKVTPKKGNDEQIEVLGLPRR